MEEFMFQDSTNKAKVFKFLMKQKKSGKLPGFCGRLGDLGEKYNVHISAFASNCIIVDTTDTGAKCIDLLHQNNIGRASFIALDAHEFCSSEGGDNTIYPDGVSQLFEIIRLEMKNAPQEMVNKVNTPRKRKVLQPLANTATSAKKIRE